MSYRIHLLSDRGLSHHRKGLAAAARAALAYTGAPPGELSLRLMDESALRALNAQFAGEDHATDVLSFPSPPDDPDLVMRYYGDIALAVPVAEAQAARAGHSVQAELILLTVHGVLHLLGYDHATDEERARMWRTQHEILDRLGVPLPAEEGTPG